MNVRTTTLLVLGLVLAATAPAFVEARPAAREDADKFVLENDHVRVWFQGKKPMLKVMPVGDDENASENASYGYKFTSLVEYRDVDGDLVPDANEVVASLALDRASGWVVNTTEAEDGTVLLNLTLSGPVRVGKPDALPREARNLTGNATDELAMPSTNASVTLLFAIRDATTTLPENITVPATAIKYDLIVHAWPFVDPELGRLALETKVTGALALDNATSRAEVEANGTTVGALTWATNATGNTTAGETVDVPVRVGVVEGGDGETTLAYTYDAPDLASLVHDPTIGVASAEGVDESGAPAGGASGGSNGVPAPGVALVVAAVAGALVLARRRRA